MPVHCGFVNKEHSHEWLFHDSAQRFFQPLQISVDAKTGATRWISPPRQGENAAVVVTGENLVLLKDDGELIVAKASGKGFEPLRHYTVAESPTWAHPLPLRKGVVIKDLNTLALWSVE